MIRPTSLVAALCGILAPLISTSAAAIVPVAVSGKPAPGTTKNLVGITNIYLNDAGFVAVRATLPEIGFLGSGLWAGQHNSLELVLHTNQPAPGLPAAIIGEVPRFGEIPITSDGHVTFGADFSYQGERGGGLWSGPANSPVLIARTGAPAPDVPGAVFDEGPFLFSAADTPGRIFFSNRLKGAGITLNNRDGLWEGPLESPALLHRAGDQAPGFAQGVVFSSGFGGTRSNESGSLAFSAVVNGPGVEPNTIPFWAGPRGSPHLVYVHGAPAPGTAPGVTFAHSAEGTTGVEWHDLNNRGDVVFYSFLQGPLVNDTNNEGIWSGAPDAIQLTARGGDPAPGMLPGVYFGTLPASSHQFAFETVLLNQRSDIAFNGRVTGIGVTEANDEALWMGPSGSLQLIAREGEQAPGLEPGAQFAVAPWYQGTLQPFTYFTPSDTGQIAFTSGLAGPTITNLNDIGLWATDLTGAVVLLSRAGDYLDVGGGELRQIESFMPWSFNSNHQLAFTARFTDGSNGAFLATVPEPATAVIAWVGLFPLLLRRRRLITNIRYK